MLMECAVMGEAGFLACLRLIRSAIVNTLWVSIRHLVVWFFVWVCSVLRWYQAGSWFFKWGDSLMAWKVSWYLRPIFSILIMSSFRIIALALLMWGFHVC